MARRLGHQDLLIALVDEGIRTLLAPPRAHRPSPAAEVPGSDDLSAAESAESARLMRVNRAGEIAAQALYLGQSLTSRNPETLDQLLAAAAEERDHLAWCTDRISELGGSTSRLDPFWFAGSACLGAAVGLAGDTTSLGFISETESQVESHLNDHLGRLPAGDDRSRAILEQMSADEARHGSNARAAGGEELPELARKLMAIGGEILRHCAYRF